MALNDASVGYNCTDAGNDDTGLTDGLIQIIVTVLVFFAGVCFLALVVLCYCFCNCGPGVVYQVRKLLGKKI